jgi:hypothetical protein
MILETFAAVGSATVHFVPQQNRGIMITYEELEILLEEVNAELELDELVLDVVLKHC